MSIEAVGYVQDLSQLNSLLNSLQKDGLTRSQKKLIIENLKDGPNYRSNWTQESLRAMVNETLCLGKKLYLPEVSFRVQNIVNAIWGIMEEVEENKVAENEIVENEVDDWEGLEMTRLFGIPESVVSMPSGAALKTEPVVSMPSPVKISEEDFVFGTVDQEDEPCYEFVNVSEVGEYLNRLQTRVNRLYEDDDLDLPMGLECLFGSDRSLTDDENVSTRAMDSSQGSVEENFYSLVDSPPPYPFESTFFHSKNDVERVVLQFEGMTKALAIKISTMLCNKNDWTADELFEELWYILKSTAVTESDLQRMVEALMSL